MNRLIMILFFLSSVFAALSSSALTSGQALRACKEHMSKVHQGVLRTKLVKARKKKGSFEVKMKASENGEYFKARCVVSEEGVISYSTDRN